MTTRVSHSKAVLVKNTAILALGKFSSQLITFLMLPLYTAFLAPDEYGIVDVVVTYVALLAPTITIQMEMAVFRFLIEARGNEIEKARVVTNALQIATVVLFGVFGVGVAAYFFLDFPYFWLVLGIIAATVMSGFCLQAARGLGRNINYAVASILSGIVTVVSNLILIVVLGLGASGLLLSMLAAQSISALYLIFSLRLFRYVRFSARDRDFKKELLRYSAPLVPNGIAWWVINAADRTIILIVLGLTANGIYAIVSKFPLVYSAVFAVFGMSWTESASVHINSKHRDQFFSDTFDAALRFFGSMALCVIASIPFVFPLLVNDSYGEAYIYIPAMILGAFFNSLVGLYSAIYVARKMTGKVANTSILSAVISISLNLLLIQFLGLFAAAIANTVAFLSMAIYRHYDIKKFVTIKYSSSLLLVLGVLYLFVVASYLLNNIYLNVVTWLLVVGIACLLNRKALGFVKYKIRAFVISKSPSR